MYATVRFWYLLLWFLTACLVSKADGQVFFLRDTFCSNQLFIVNGHLYGPDHPTGTEILPGAAANGADSIIEVRLVFLSPVTLVLERTLCLYDTLWVNGVAYHAGFTAGTETVENGAANGCDSIIQVKLSFKDQVLVQIAQPICEGDTLLINGTAYTAFHPSGKEVFSTSGGCDSIVQVNLSPVPLPFSEVTDTLCPDSFLIINGHRYDANDRSGLEIIPGAGENGCDSLVNVRLNFRELWVYLGEDQTISAGDSLCLSPLTNFKIAEIAWEPPLPCGTPDCYNFCAVLFKNQSYQVYATDTSGCKLTDAIKIGVKKEPPVYAPNIFSPDAAWPNNYFFLGAGAGIVRIVNLQIADRWGELVWTGQNIAPDTPTEGWNGHWKGKPAPPGVYVFWAEVEWWDGTRETMSGGFALVR